MSQRVARTPTKKRRSIAVWTRNITQSRVILQEGRERKTRGKKKIKMKQRTARH